MANGTTAQLAMGDYLAPEDIRETIRALLNDREMFLCPVDQPEVRVRCSPCEGYPFQKVLLKDGQFSHTQALNRRQVATRIREEDYTLKRDPELAAEVIA